MTPPGTTPIQRALFDLSGRVGVVIGASEGSIGGAIAVALAQAGATVVVAGRNAERLASTRALVEETGAGGSSELVDVSDPESIARLSEIVVETHGPPTVLVNGAGVSVTKDAFDITVDDWDSVHDTHLRGTFFSCQAFGRHMAQDGYGKIINLSSTWAVTTGPKRSVYCAAKAGVSHLSSALAVEWAPLGVRVNALAPAATMTPTIEERLKQHPGREEYLRGGIPMGRLATPEDMVGAALFLASPASDFVTGHTLFVDGGWVTAK